MELPIKFETVKSGRSIVYIEWLQVKISKKCIYCSEDRFCLSKQCRHWCNAAVWWILIILQDASPELSISWSQTMNTRVKSGKFGQSSKFGQRPYFFHFWIFGINIKLNKQTVKILMRRLIKSRLIWIVTVCKCMSEFTCCPKFPGFTL